MKKFSYLFVAFATCFLIACGGDAKTSDSSRDSFDDEDEIELDAEVEEDTDVSEDLNSIDVETSNTISLEGNDQMQYNANEFHVKAGEPITLHFKNVGKLPVEAMGHDVVVLEPGSDVTEFGKAATRARDIEKMDSKFQDQIIAMTDMMGPGEETEITFTLDKGEYNFLCSFPAHYATMNGKIFAH